MWICLNDAFLSIVSHYDDPNKLLVRSRVKGHIEKVFTGARVYQRERSDYLYRAEVPRTEVAAVISGRLMKIDYTNFKGSVKDRQLHDAYAGFWAIMYRLQDKLAPISKKLFAKKSSVADRPVTRPSNAEVIAKTLPQKSKK